MSKWKVSRFELTWLWWPYGWYGTPSGDRKCTLQGTGLPVSSSRTVTWTQFLPLSTRLRRAAGVSTLPFSSKTPQATSATGSPSCSTETVADGTADTSTYDGLAVVFWASPQPLYGSFRKSSDDCSGSAYTYVASPRSTDTSRSNGLSFASSPLSSMRTGRRLRRANGCSSTFARVSPPSSIAPASGMTSSDSMTSSGRGLTQAHSENGSASPAWPSIWRLPASPKLPSCLDRRDEYSAPTAANVPRSERGVPISNCSRTSTRSSPPPANRKTYSATRAPVGEPSATSSRRWATITRRAEPPMGTATDWLAPSATTTRSAPAEPSRNGSPRIVLGPSGSSASSSTASALLLQTSVRSMGS